MLVHDYEGVLVGLTRTKCGEIKRAGCGKLERTPVDLGNEPWSSNSRALSVEITLGGT